jgi:mono/diheme cytochrome c family protein
MIVRFAPALAALVAATAGCTSLAYGQEDIAAGRDLAINLCSECHSVQPDGSVSPNSESPAFVQIANTPGMTALSIRVFLQSPHRAMPLLVLEPSEIENVAAYIISLKRTAP